MSDFFLAVKSSIDRLAADVAGQLNVSEYVDLDDRVNAARIETDNKPAVVWQLASFAPTPRDPMYDVTFAVGIKTINDPSNYQLTRLAAAISTRIYVGADFDVMDYSGTVAPTVSLGWIFIASIQTNQILYDNMANVRLHEIRAKAVRT